MLLAATALAVALPTAASADPISGINSLPGGTALNLPTANTTGSGPIVVSPGVTWSSTYSGSLYGWTGAYSPSNLVIGAGPNTPLIGLNIGYTDASPQPPAYATMTLRFDAPISGILAEIFWADGTSGGNSANIAIYNSAGTLLDYTPFNNNGGSIGLSSGYYGFFRPQGDIAYINFNNGFIGARNITLLGNPAVGAVPEPSTWAMMLAGFGAIGFAVRRSRPRRAVAA
jgi:hypothetical protein